jgi:hypothetical protein
VVSSFTAALVASLILAGHFAPSVILVVGIVRNDPKALAGRPLQSTGLTGHRCLLG